MAFCLTKQAKERFKQALKSREFNPVSFSELENTEARRAYVEKFVGKENAQQVNAMYEKTLGMKNQKAGFITATKKVLGLKTPAGRDMISKIQRMDELLNPVDEQSFYEDLVAQKLGIGISIDEAKNISELSNKVTELRAKANEEGIFKTEQDRLAYGASKVALEKYVNDLKLQTREVNIIREAPGAFKSAVASLDNSFWGRQGIKTLLDIRTSKIWIRNFLKSWRDIGSELKGNDAMDAIRADIYSRPNALNGKYDAGNYGLSVLTEEAFPSSLPERIPALGRLYKASESAYNGGALRMRADLADRIISIAEKQGFNTLDKEYAKGLGSLVNSMTGRGSIGVLEPAGGKINVVLFSIKFFKANLDTATAHLFDPKVRANPTARKEAAKSLLSMIVSIAAILSIAKSLDPDSVDEDPRSQNFGKIKIFGHWTDITGGIASIYTLAARTLIPSVHDGELGLWKKSTSGEWTNLTGGEYKQDDAWDLLIDSLFTNKLSPTFGLFRDAMRQKFFSGEKFTPGKAVINLVTPLSIQNADAFSKDPASSFILGSILLELLGFSTSSYPEPNIKTGAIPEGKKTSNENIINTTIIYANAIGTDPETAFNRIFTGQRIRRVDNGTVIVERMPLKDSQAIKKKAGKNNPLVKLDHTVPLQLGGSNSPDNLKLVTTSQHSSYTKVENALGRALKKKKIDKGQAQALIKKFKSIQDAGDRKTYGDNIIRKYK